MHVKQMSYAQSTREVRRTTDLATLKPQLCNNLASALYSESKPICEIG